MSGAGTIDFATYWEIASFLRHEARLLDEGRWTEWLDLFAADGVYWIPGSPGQQDAQEVPSIVYEGRAILALRVARLMHPRAYAAVPPPRTLHLIGNLDIEDAGRSECIVSSNLVVMEYQDGQRRLFGGRCRHVLRRQERGFAIVQKRVDLIDCEGAFEAMTSLL